MENLGRIHSFESFGTVDGPGIRYVVFMQGCPLKCKYCHNRDTWDVNGGKEYTVDEVLKKISSCVPYIKASNGGVTISGGEPLLQAKFITELFKKLHEMNIHTAIDTAGSIKIIPEIEELLKYTDLVLLDIKHIDNEKCINLTGTSNTNTLAFENYLEEHNIPVWIRQVLLPGYTDDEEDLKKLKNYLITLKNLKKVEILPYHDLGKFKWEELGFDYSLENVKAPSTEEINHAKEILGICNEEHKS
jgi:pyruvate formate lyase activating enzyme